MMKIIKMIKSLMITTLRFFHVFFGDAYLKTIIEVTTNVTINISPRISSAAFQKPNVRSPCERSAPARSVVGAKNISWQELPASH
jgi:hypothetical protein